MGYNISYNIDNMTIDFLKFLTDELLKIYGKGSGVKVDRATIEYKLIDDSDYPTISEHILFTMKDGRQFEGSLWHKEQSHFEEIKEVE